MERPSMRAITGEGGGAGGGVGGGFWARTARLEPAITQNVATTTQPRGTRPAWGSDTIKISVSWCRSDGSIGWPGAFMESLGLSKRAGRLASGGGDRQRGAATTPRLQGEDDRPARR